MAKLDLSDPWRYRCPEGHTSWQSRDTENHHKAESKYYCEGCRKNGDDPHFDSLYDAKHQ